MINYVLSEYDKSKGKVGVGLDKDDIFSSWFHIQRAYPLVRTRTSLHERDLVV